MIIGLLGQSDQGDRRRGVGGRDSLGDGLAVGIGNIGGVIDARRDGVIGADRDLVVEQVRDPAPGAIAFKGIAPSPAWY